MEKIKVIIQIKNKFGNYSDLAREFYSQSGLDRYLRVIENNGSKVIGIVDNDDSEGSQE